MIGAITGFSTGSIICNFAKMGILAPFCLLGVILIVILFMSMLINFLRPKNFQENWNGMAHTFKGKLFGVICYIFGYFFFSGLAMLMGYSTLIKG